MSWKRKFVRNWGRLGMRSEWENKKIGDIVDVRRGSSPRPIHKYLATNGVPWVKIADATSDNSRYIWRTSEYITNDGVEKSVQIEPETLIVSNSATPGLPKIMKITACVHDGWLVFSNYRGVLRDFLYYKFIDIRRVLINQANGSVFQNLKTDIVRNFDISIPNTSIQIKIVNILSNIDDKIELNNRINNNLEQQVQTLFRNQFLTQKFLPDGWTRATLGDVSLMGAGGDKPKTVSDTQTENCPYPIYSNGISNDGLYGFTNECKIKDESITVSARGTIGFVCLRHIPYTPIVRLITLIPKTDVLSAKYLYLWLRNMHIYGTGTTQQQLTVPDFRKTDIILPTKEEMTLFTDTITPLFEAIWENQAQNLKLSNTRDALLPMLMSGKLDISYLDL